MNALTHPQSRPPLTLSERLYTLSKASGLPRRGLSVRLAAICGVTDKAAQKWLTEEATPSKGNVIKLATALGCSAAYLMFGERAEEDNQGEPLPIPLRMVLESYLAGALESDDLELIEALAKRLASKNAQHGPDRQTHRLAH